MQSGISAVLLMQHTDFYESSRAFVFLMTFDTQEYYSLIFKILVKWLQKNRRNAGVACSTLIESAHWITQGLQDIRINGQNMSFCWLASSEIGSCYHLQKLFRKEQSSFYATNASCTFCSELAIRRHISNTANWHEMALCKWHCLQAKF